MWGLAEGGEPAIRVFECVPLPFPAIRHEQLAMAAMAIEYRCSIVYAIVKCGVPEQARAGCEQVFESSG